MVFFSATNLIRSAAALLILCAILHSVSWKATRERFPAKEKAFAAVLWFLLAIDWVVFGCLWLIAASGGVAMQPFLLLSSVIPLAVTAGLCLTAGFTFFPMYLQLGAFLLLVAGTLRLA